VLAEPLLAWRFRSEDGGRRGRLGLWLLEVLGGPDLFSSSFPGATTREGPLDNDRLDLEERERLLEIAENALPEALEEQGRCVVGNLRAHLPLHPTPPSLLTSTLLLDSGDPDSAEEEPSSEAPHSDVWHARHPAAAQHDSARQDPSQHHSPERVPSDYPAARAAAAPWPHRSRPAPTLRGRITGKWPRWRDRSR